MKSNCNEKKGGLKTEILRQFSKRLEINGLLLQPHKNFISCGFDKSFGNLHLKGQKREVKQSYHETIRFRKIFTFAVALRSTPEKVGDELNSISHFF